MKFLTYTTDYLATIELAKQLVISEEESKTIEPVTFHCYWNGQLNDKHVISIGSCYHFHGKQHKIILWIENNEPNEFNNIIDNWAEIRQFSYKDEIKDANNLFDNYEYKDKYPPNYSDIVRYLLLYKYGGCWFDLDILFLRSFNPIFYHFKNETCVYQWENQNHPNGAIYISLTKNSRDLKEIIEFYKNYRSNWGFQNGDITYDMPFNLLVLPCSWFDAAWIENPYRITFDNFFQATNKRYNLNTLFNGAFCLHWHNRWNTPIEIDSPLHQLWKCMY